MDVFNQNGDLEFSFGNWDKDKIIHPRRVCVDSEDNVLVTDEKGILIFDKYGIPVQRIETPFQPFEICTIDYFILVSEYGGSRMCVFSN